jgi:hypothetical protein
MLQFLNNFTSDSGDVFIPALRRAARSHSAVRNEYRTVGRVGK